MDNFVIDRAQWFNGKDIQYDEEHGDLSGKTN